jgi:HEPN domain-containing protein
MKASTKQWLEFAQTDLRSCENNLNDEFVTNVVAFHAQQAVEKAFKALIEEKGIRMSRIHNLTRLLALTESFLISPIDETELEMLDNVYSSSRYPGEIGLLSTGKPSIKESKELYGMALKISEILIHSIEKQEIKPK